MTYTLSINQKQAISLGLTNVNQVIILGLIAEVHSWAEPEIIDNTVYYWTARQKIVEELPLLNLKPDSVYRHLKSLAKLGLIDYVKNGKKDCVILTKKGKSYYVGNKSEKEESSEINPSEFGNKSENNSEMNPTYKNTNLIRVTRDKSKELTSSSYTSAEKISNYLLSKIISVNPKFKKPNLKGWIDEIEKAIRLDNRTEQELINAIDWIYTPAGSFWQKNILSGKKLREKYDTMNMQVISNKKQENTSAVDEIYNQGLTATEMIKQMGATS